jgi:hypothetical protein
MRETLVEYCVTRLVITIASERRKNTRKHILRDISRAHTRTEKASMACAVQRWRTKLWLWVWWLGAAALVRVCVPVHACVPVRVHIVLLLHYDAHYARSPVHWLSFVGIEGDQ